MVSIIIPVYNQATKLKACLSSLLKQTYQDYEIIIIDDGSTDDLSSIINDYKNKFKVDFKFISQANQGANVARNRGLQEASGQYLLFSDADIIWRVDALENMVRAMEGNSGVSFVYSSFKYGWKTFKLFPFSVDLLKKMPYIHTSSLIKKEHFPGFDNSLKRLQDWDLFLTMTEQGRTGLWIDQILFKAQAGGVISTWLPSFAYKLMPWLKQVKQYKSAKKIISDKHQLA